MTGRRDGEYKLRIYDELKQYGKKCGYKLLSPEYVSVNSDLQWQKDDGTIFIQRPASIRQYGWIKNIKLSRGQRASKKQHLLDLEKMAKKRGGKILTTEYINTNQLIRCQDANGNHFETAAYRIKQGGWSPFEKMVSEHICRQAFEYIFNDHFPSTWNVITRRGKRNLQLDGYNGKIVVDDKQYKIAFEYQGDQTHRNNKETMNRDKEKIIYCKDNGISLVVVQPFKQLQLKDDTYIIDTVISYIEHFNVPIPSIDLSMFRASFKNLNHCVQEHTKWEKYGANEGYILLSTQYINNSTPLLWMRKDGYKFHRSVGHIQQDGWPKFNTASYAQLKSSPDFIEDLQKISKNRGGELLSDEYISATEKMLFKDVSGNEFYITPNAVKNGQWSIFETTNGGASRKKIDNMIYIKTKKGDTIIYEIIDGNLFLNHHHPPR